MSETTPTETATVETETVTTEHEQGTEQETQKPSETVDFWKAKAREQEKRAKANADAAKRLQEIEDASKSETDKLTERATQAEHTAQEWAQRYQTLVKDQAITKAAAEARAIDVDVVTALIGDQVTVNDQGAVEGLDKALRDLVKTKPHLFNTTPAGTRDAGAGSITTTRATPAQLFADAFQGRV